MTSPKKYPEWVVQPSEQRMYDDVRVFTWVLWKHLKLPDPTPLQYDIVQYLAHGPKRRMVQAARGFGKSWLAASVVLWKLYRDPQERILVVSANEERSIAFATFVRRLIDEVPQLRHLRPKDGTRDSVLSFDVGPANASQAPSVRAVGINGQLTGGRASFILADDCEVPRNSASEVQREKLSEAVKEFDAVLVPGGEIAYLGTPQSAQSIYTQVRQRGYDCRIWPARYPDPGTAAKYDGALAPSLLQKVAADPSLVGRSTEPARFTDLDLAEREGSYGASAFRLQFLLDTSLSDAERYPLKQSDFILADIDMEVAPAKLVWCSDPAKAEKDIPNLGFNGDRLHRALYTSDTVLPFTGRLMVIDPSGRGLDETAYVVLFCQGGMLYLKAWGGFKDGYGDQTLEGLSAIAAEHKVNTVLVESNFSDGLFSKLLEPVLRKFHPCTLEEVRATGQKEKRIIADVEPVLNQHRLVIDAKAAKRDAQLANDGKEFKHSLLYQLTHLTADRNSLRHDDKIDALAHGVRWFAARLVIDVQTAEEEHLEKLRNEQMAEFRRQWFSKTPQAKPGFAMTNRGLRR